MRNIKSMLSHPGWADLSKIMEGKIAEIDKEILTEAGKSSPNLDILRQKSAERLAKQELLSEPHFLL